MFCFVALAGWTGWSGRGDSARLAPAFPVEAVKASGFVIVARTVSLRLAVSHESPKWEPLLFCSCNYWATLYSRRRFPYPMTWSLGSISVTFDCCVVLVISERSQ